MNEELRQALSYDPETGTLRWLISPCSNVKAGDVAGSLNWRGYRRIQFRGKYFAASRLAWFLMTGEWPDGLIDHKNLNTRDDRWENLRLATHAQNSQNTPSRNALLKGVTRLKSGKFQAQIACAGKRYHIGTFPSEIEAHEAYAAKARELHGEFARVA